MRWAHRGGSGRTARLRAVGTVALACAVLAALCSEPVAALSAVPVQAEGEGEVTGGDTGHAGGDDTDHADGGELRSDALTEALEDATPEELEERRAEVAERLAAASSVEEFVTDLEAEAATRFAEVDAALEEAQAELVAARAEAAATRAEHADAVEVSAAASERAEQAEAELRDAAVDMFINPPQADSVRASLSGTVDEEMASTGLLVGRAEARRQVSRRRDRALAAAAKAEGEADRASRAAEAAISRVEDATEALEAQLVERSLEMLRVREQLEAARAEVAGLQLTDSVLAARIALDALTHSGAVTAQLDAQGNWVPDVSGLPTRADMVRIGDTNVWVHHLVAPSVFAMFLAALGDGVVLAGSAHRDSLRQIELRASHCGGSYEAIFTAPSSSCSPPTARPGQSMHERGLAIDFTEGGRVLTRSSASFAWLQQNAADYGFFNLPSEPWHWSVNGR